MSKDINVMYSHNSDDWRTPSKIYDYFMSLGYIDLFPFQSEDNQFEKDYLDKRLFCNPPFSKMDLVIDYLVHQYSLGNQVVLLCPARTDTKWFHKLLEYNPRIYFIKGRLHFNDGPRVAPFPTLLIYLDHKAIMPLWSVYLVK